MTDILLLTGTSLCVLSLLLAVISLARTEPPRSAAAVFVLGIAAIFLAAWLSPAPFALQDIGAAWSRLLAGELRVTLLR